MHSSLYLALSGDQKATKRYQCGVSRLTSSLRAKRNLSQYSFSKESNTIAVSIEPVEESQADDTKQAITNESFYEQTPMTNLAS